jgi:hypothetical protein
VSEPCFYSWRRTLAERDQPAADPLPAPEVRTDELPAFVPVHVTAATAPALELVLGSGRVIRVPPDFDAAMLRRLLQLLEEGPSC